MPAWINNTFLTFPFVHWEPPADVNAAANPTGLSQLLLLALGLTTAAVAAAAAALVCRRPASKRYSYSSFSAVGYMTRNRRLILGLGILVVTVAGAVWAYSSPWAVVLRFKRAALRGVDGNRCTRLDTALEGACALGAASGADGGLQCALLHSLAHDPVKYLAFGPALVAPVRKPMVISAGFGATGTRSLASMLSQLGYRVADFEPEMVLWSLVHRNFTPMATYA